MPATAILQLLLLVALIGVLVPATGRYLAAVFDGGPHRTDRLFVPVERRIYRVCGVNPDSEQTWISYVRSLLTFGLVGFVWLYLLLRLQPSLPGRPDMPGVAAPLAFNIAISFVTNTNWQAYGGESTLTQTSQMVGLTVQNFVSAATGMAVGIAVIRGVARTRSATIGNFWVDLVRSVVRILVPFAMVGTVLLVATGVIQNLDPDTVVTTVEGATQTIPGGPVASQLSIKQLGTNGGGYFNTNSAHPFENPSAVSNLIEITMILLIPLAFPVAFGRMVGDRRQGRVLLAVMVGLLSIAVVVATLAEASGNRRLDPLGVDQSISAEQGGGNLEGKELRIGAAASGTWAAATTNTSNGSVNSMHDSFTAVGGGIALLGMLLGEVSPGGVGVGFMGLFVYALLAVFIAGLMVGRTPEYLGKKIQAAEMKLIMLYLLAVPLVVLPLSAVSVVWSSATESIQDPGPHGLTEMLYAFGSGGNNNGSSFAGFGANTPWFNGAIGAAMFVGRFFLIIPALALAGSLAAKPRVPQTSGTLPTNGAMFGGLVAGVVLVIAGLTFFPALALGPIVEQLTR